MKDKKFCHGYLTLNNLFVPLNELAHVFTIIDFHRHPHPTWAIYSSAHTITICPRSAIANAAMYMHMSVLNVGLTFELDTINLPLACLILRQGLSLGCAEVTHPHINQSMKAFPNTPSASNTGKITPSKTKLKLSKSDILKLSVYLPFRTQE